MQNNTISLAKKLEIYGESFQLFLLKAVLEDSAFYRSVKDYFKSSFITLDYLKVIFEGVEQIYAKHGYVPTYGNIESYIRNELAHNEYERELSLKALFHIKQEGFKDEAFIKEKTLAFCKTQAVINATAKSTEILDYYNLHPEEDPDFTKIIEQWNSINRIELDRIEDDAIEVFDEFYKNESSRLNIVPSGWELYDYLLNGGLASGEVHTIAAYTNVGKTTACVNVGAKAFLEGKSVLHFAFENPINASYYSRISGIPIRSVQKFKEETRRVLKEQQEKTGGKLYIRNYPMIKHTISTLENYCEKLRDEKNISPDLIIIDSPLHLLPSLKRDNERESVGVVWKDVKAFAQTLKCPVLVTAQLNRDSKLNQKQVAGSEFVGASIDIARDSDTFMTINRSTEDFDNGVGTFFLSKNRFGKTSMKWKVLFKEECAKITEDDNETKATLEKLRMADAFSMIDEHNDSPGALIINK